MDLNDYQEAVTLGGHHFDRFRACAACGDIDGCHLWRTRALKPKLVCLCGSTKFYEEFMQANYEETMAGRIVLSVGFFMHRPETAHAETLGCTPEQKIKLDELHKRKIDLADEVLVIDKNGYIGASTLGEIEYAKAHFKVIRYWSLERIG